MGCEPSVQMRLPWDVAVPCRAHRFALYAHRLAMSESTTTGKTGTAAAGARPRRRARGWRLASFAAAVPVIALAGGFFWYAALVDEATAPDRSADGIVALTGGPERI